MKTKLTINPVTGQLDLVTSSLDASTDLTGTLAIANGGTGQTTANTAFNALVPSQTSNSGKFLTTDGSNTSWATVSGASLTTAVSSTGGATARNFSTITSGGYGAMASNSVSLTTGTWEIDSFYSANTGTGTVCVFYSNTGLYAANGADSGTAPTALSTIGTVTGPATFGDIAGTTIASAATATGWSVSLKTYLAVSSTQTVYAVPRVDFGTAGTATAYVYIIARKLF
jgi:hypothetical protein